MAEKKISDLTSKDNISNNDELVFVDKAITSGTDAGVGGQTSKIKFSDLKTAVGTSGPQGATGAQGAVGNQGARGSQGNVGAQGAKGSQGNVGSQGAKGSQGSTGTGAQGRQGAKGSQGSTGTGAQGRQGAKGSQGSTGTGAQGRQGAKGSQGSSGSPWSGGTFTGSVSLNSQNSLYLKNSNNTTNYRMYTSSVSNFIDSAGVNVNQLNIMTSATQGSTNSCLNLNDKIQIYTGDSAAPAYRIMARNGTSSVGLWLQSCSDYGSSINLRPSTEDGKTVYGDVTMWTGHKSEGYWGARCSVNGGGDASFYPQFSTANDPELGQHTSRWDNIYLKNQPNVSSDINLKHSIEISDLGLDFICKLKPVKYKFKNEVKFDENEEPVGEVVHKRNHYGLIAQDVEQLLEGKDFAGLVDPSITNREGPMGLRYGEFIAPLIKAVQELTKKVNELENR